MSNRRFIELSSSSRNRNRYPYPAEFEVPFAPSRTLNITTIIKGAYNNNNNTIYSVSMKDAADPVTSGIVDYQWYGSNTMVDIGLSGTSITSSGSIPITASGLKSTPSYTGYNIVFNNQQYPITSSPLPNTSITFTAASSTTISNGLGFQITTNNTTPSVTCLSAPVRYLDTTTLQANSTTTKFYINVSTLLSPYKSVTNFYVGYLLVVKTAGIAGIINSYNPSSGLMTVSVPLLTTQTITTGDDVYIIDCSNGTSIPLTFTSAASPTTTYVAQPQTIVFPMIDATGKLLNVYDQAYHGFYVVDETQSSLQHMIVSSMIVSYNFLLNTATLATALTNWTSIDMYSIRKTLPSIITYTSTPTLLPPDFSPPITNSSCIYLPAQYSNVDNYYNGQYIYIYPKQTLDNQVSPLTNIQGTCYFINSYIGGSYNVCFVSPLFIPDLKSPTQYYPSYNCSGAIFPLEGSVINITSFLNDNYNPLIYNGSVVSQNETVAYEISLVNLTLPNITLVTGSRAAFYPYVYVEITNVTASSGSSKNIIYSNNPHSGRALFIVPITDITDPIRSPFIKLDAGSMVQTVKFKPNDCLRFSVFLPDGELFQTVTSDYYNPSAPNVIVQIDALFGIRRLSGI